MVVLDLWSIQNWKVGLEVPSIPLGRPRMLGVVFEDNTCGGYWSRDPLEMLHFSFERMAAFSSGGVLQLRVIVDSGTFLLQSRLPSSRHGKMTRVDSNSTH